ncbi:MAG: ABC transporter permease [Acidobacteria bacterium]|nr:ABC transporter permease [Acidobacteriota bacterium]MDA1236857.1 ABC transporter permease [Acidobacteriota bacterium]
MSVLHKKLYREVWGMRGQALAIAMVIASGVATFVMSLSTLHSLQDTQAAFYRDFRFAEVFVSLKRAPESVADRIRDIPGVDYVQTGVVAGVNLDVEGYEDPATALLVSVREDSGSQLNQIYLREGRHVDPTRDDEAVVSEAFAEAQKLSPGDRVSVIINGHKKELTLVGLALSPEFVHQIKPGAIVPDFKSYAILWMAEKPLATAYDMYGAFNNVALTLTPGANAAEVIDQLDAILARYGGRGSYARADQLSHRFLSEEFRQLESMATVYPTIFLGVAAFLLNVVFSRLFQTEREQIATLKAFGYSNWSIGIHYLQFVGVIASVGIVLGIIGGGWLGQGLSSMYMDFYRFPFLHYSIGPAVVTAAALISFAASVGGTIFAVRRAAKQPPAEAMRPEAPARYRRSFIDRSILGRAFSEPARMIVRNIQRRPVKALTTSFGIAASFAILVMGLFFGDSIEYMLDVQFRLSERDDISVSFVEPTSYSALLALQRLPGVDYAEGFRAVPVRFRVGHRTYRTAILGVQPGGDLYKTLDSNLNAVEPPEEGLVLTDYLAELLHVKPGEDVTVEVLEGSRPIRQTPLAGTVNQFLGVSGYMRLDALNRFMREGSALSGVRLAVDSAYQQEVYDAIKEMPRVAGTEIKQKAAQSLRETMGEQILIFAGITTLLAATIAFGVVYNSARITLSERARELASLRVLGFTRGEAAFILLGELAILTVLAIPLGIGLSTILCQYFIQTWQTDLFRIPLVLTPGTFSYAALVVLICSLVSGMIVRRRINDLDLVGVLKTRE